MFSRMLHALFGNYCKPFCCDVFAFASDDLISFPSQLALIVDAKTVTSTASYAWEMNHGLLNAIPKFHNRILMDVISHMPRWAGSFGDLPSAAFPQMRCVISVLLSVMV